MSEIFDPRKCALGEGPLWHPLRQQLFWFDILGKQLLSRKDGAQMAWQFDEHASAAGWIDRDTLLIASETCLQKFDLTTGTGQPLIALEADNDVTRSNDGRADPWVGFWIGTMGKSTERRAGKIYRYFEGALTVLFDEITISNAICFAPDRSTAYFTDTAQQQIMAQPLDPQGWPKGAANVFVDLRAEGLFPDGAVVDREGCLWNAQWGAGRVARYSPTGVFLSQLPLPASQTTCPAFGGENLQTLFVTSAFQGLEKPGLSDGQLFTTETGISGLPEPKVVLK
jgi:sugar lactone lactonase YvrE